MNKNVAVVILNYNTFEDTVECVNSIRKQDYQQDCIHIVIVDNSSTDDSADRLKKEFYGQNVHFLQSKKNLGFANGNNLGILYAREILHTNYVYLENSDVEFYDTNVLSETMSAVEDGIAVIAPEIINLKYEPAYLARLQLPTFKELKKEYLKRKIYLLIEKNGLLNSIYSKFKKKRTVYIPPVYDGKTTRPPEISNDMWLPGCGFLLTPYYFKHYKMLYPYTFMYYEESILSVLCVKGGVNLKFFNTSRLLHKDGRATNTLCEKISSAKLEMFCHGCKVLLSVMKMPYLKIQKRIDRYPVSVEKDCSFAGVLK